MNEIFNPALAVRQLKENAWEMEKLADRIIAARSECTLAEAQLLDAEDASRRNSLEKGQIGVTLMKEYMKIDTHHNQKNLLEKECRLRNLNDLMKVLETSNNNLKVQIKLAQSEIGNLNLTQM